MSPGKYRLKSAVSNPCPNLLAKEDWRNRPTWPEGTEFYVFPFYHALKHEVPAIYHGKRPEVMITEERRPEIFRALVLYLERV